MFLRFTKFSRPVHGFIIALLLLFAPALIAATATGATQRNKAKPAPTPKKKTTPTPKKTQAKTKAAPTPSKFKSSSKNASQTASKNKTVAKKNEKTTAKTNQKTNDRNKSSKTPDKKNQKQTIASKNSRNERNSRSSDKNKNVSSKNTKQVTDKNKTASRNTRTTKPTIAKTTENKSKNGKTNRTDDVIIDNSTQTESKTQTPQIIVTTFSVPLKSQAKADAATLSNVKLGTILKVTEKNPAWYKVQYSADGKTATGWISANAVNDLNAAGKTELYGQIVERNYKPQMDFQSATEFYEFTSKVGGELDSSDKSADIELKRLLALRAALKTIPLEKTEAAPYKDFLKSQEKEIVYNEPAGQWLVASNQFWNLHNKYKKTGVSDTIAWEAANNPLPGECEGYVNCYLFDMRMRFGEYLNLHPNGRNSPEALKNLSDYLAPIVADSSRKEVYQGPTDVTDRAEFNNLLAELRTIIARLPFVEKEKALQQLRTIAEAYR